MAKNRQLTVEEEAFLKQYRKEIAALPAATEEEITVLMQGAQDGDREAIKRITEIWAPKIIDLALDRLVKGIHLGDLVQEGNLALFQALVFPDEEAAESVSASYLDQTVIASMESFVAEYLGESGQSDEVVDKLNKLAEAVEMLTEDYGDAFTLDDVAYETDMTLEEMKELLKLAGEDLDEEMAEPEL